VAHDVKRWQGGDHIARWTAAGLLEAEKKFRRVKGYRELKELAAKLSRSRSFGIRDALDSTAVSGVKCRSSRAASFN